MLTMKLRKERGANMREKDALRRVMERREMLNNGQVHENNALVADDFFAVFALGNPGEFETYNAEQYRAGNLQAVELYRGKSPHWGYTDHNWGYRSDTEFVISSSIDFSLNGELFMRAMVMEVYRRRDSEWLLVRQYMEKYKPT